MKQRDLKCSPSDDIGRKSLVLIVFDLLISVGQVYFTNRFLELILPFITLSFTIYLFRKASGLKKYEQNAKERKKLKWLIIVLIAYCVWKSIRIVEVCVRGLH